MSGGHCWPLRLEWCRLPSLARIVAGRHDEALGRKAIDTFSTTGDSPYSMLRLAYVDHRVEAIARRIHAVQLLAYREEARLLGATCFPPLERSVGDLRASSEEFLCAYWAEQLVAALGTCPDTEVHGVNIASLVVHPDFQRRGLGRRLLSETVTRHAAVAITIQTGTRNTPALTLYGQFGFREIRRWSEGPEPLELVRLVRPAAAAQLIT
jgi:ribosomal protein S18 acetylase RimI-like enzyme